MECSSWWPSQFGGAGRVRGQSVALVGTTRDQLECLGALVTHGLIPLFTRQISRPADTGLRRDTVGI